MLAAGLSPAVASFHLMVIQEVFPGTPDNPQAQYVMLRMTNVGQSQVSTKAIVVQDASGVVIGRFGTFDHNVNGGTAGCSYPNCRAILIGTSAAQTLLGFDFDQIVDAETGRVALPLAGGRVCFKTPTSTTAVDCVAYGDFTAANTIPTPTESGCDANFGAPAASLSSGFALTRKQFNCVANENSLDFQNRFPHPVNNAGTSANTDPDADGLISVLDCADNDNTSLYAPIEVSGVDVIGLPPLISWLSTSALTGTSTRYDVALASLAELGGSGTLTSASCMAGQVNGLNTTDNGSDPSPGDAFFYQARGRNTCGKGTYGLAGLNNPLDDPCP